MSQLNEPQGQMVFPLHLVEPKVMESQLVISVFHHPDRWLESNNSRPFRELIEQLSDIILTGHEHVANRFTKQTRIGAYNEYIEGGVLQESNNPQESGFNIIEINFDSKERRITTFNLVKDIYKVVDTSEWRHFELNEKLRSEKFINNDDFTSKLLETGTPFSHSSHRTLTLPDIFIYPELDTMPFDRKRNKEIDIIIPGEKVLQFALEHPLLMVIGADQSGKTSLAKTLYNDFRDRAIIPVLLSGDDIKSTEEERLLHLIDTEVAAQYDLSAISNYQQLDKDNRVLIIDDFDHTTIKNRQGHNLIIESLQKHFDRIIIFVGDIFHYSELAQAKNDESALNAFRHVEIREFGNWPRYQLITKWLTFDQDYTLDEKDIEHQIQEYANKVSTLLIRKTVPSYPVIVLSMLQMLDINREAPPDSEKGEFGYFYESFILQKLKLWKDTSIPTSAIVAYTFNLAYKLFIKKQRTINEKELNQFTIEYCEKYSMSLSQAALVDVLIKTEILLPTDEGLYCFKHKFIYYYFVAKYIATYLHTNAEEEELRKLISSMIHRVYVEDFYNILMFILYLTYDEKILDELINNGKAFYSEHNPCDLDEHVKHINNVQYELKPLSLTNEDTKTNRIKHEKDLDDFDYLADGGNIQYELDELDEQRKLDDIMKINVAFRTLKIMGQVLRNFSGILLGPTKLNLTRESYFLGLRILKFMLVLIDENVDYFREILSNLLQEHEQITDLDILEKRTNELLFKVQAGLSHGLIKRISQAVGSRHLRETYKSILTEENQLSVKLIDVAIKLDHFVGFPKKDVEEIYKAIRKNPFTLSILQTLVRDRFLLFTESRTLRQSVCDTVGIKIDIPKMLSKKSKK